ncbi:MAG: MMPL family transporter [Sedimentisphaerales bacterium]|nr:MMPL family transporter [Sedimentisphaerales bacterium]
MELRELISSFSIRHYRMVTIVMVLVTLGLGAMIPMIKTDTDPENMLAEDEAVRIFHDQAKKTFSLSDIVVLGIVNRENPDGVFNPETLSRIFELTEYAKTLRWPDEQQDGGGAGEVEGGRAAGVIEVDILSPSTVDHISQGKPGEVKFEWLMPQPPKTAQEALEIRDRAMSNPMLKGTLVSEDGKALCLYLPLTSKDLSYRVYKSLNEKIASFDGPEQYFITGLPVAEDTFGVEMFIQMAVSAPLAMIVIFLLMLFFFRKLVLVISPMIIAMVSVITTMGLLIGLGHPVHIMSSMIPIFLMPIAVVDSVHILSEFFDRYDPKIGREKTIRRVMHHLFTPMLYTSLTSAAGFASLALTPIPPVQVFGVFVAVGILIAWLFTVTFVPAYVMMLSEKSLANFGSAAAHGHEGGRMGRWLAAGGRLTFVGAKGIILAVLVLAAVAGWGMSRIQINDNPVKWFSKSHPIRQADIELNQHFGGTYMAYLVLEGQAEHGLSSDYLEAVNGRLDKAVEKLSQDYPGAAELGKQAKKLFNEKAASMGDKEKLIEGKASVTNDKEKPSEEKAAAGNDKEGLLGELIVALEALAEQAKSDDDYDAWTELAAFFGLEKERLKIFKQPEALRYIEQVQRHLERATAGGGKLVGKSNSIAGVVKKVHQELIDGREENYRIPESSAAVAECLLQYQSSHKPNDLWHLVTSDYQKANIWVQLTSGDNKDMNQVVATMEKFFKSNPPPMPMQYRWAGLTYINVVWQDKMVSGMLQSFLGSFLVVFIMMSILFRSPLWGLICMIPLTVTILLIYGVIGLVGKDYDMPVAVLSALTLGMAVDFAIHFLERARSTYSEKGSWQLAVVEMFGEPARAISRNVLVIAIGFLPLLAAPLMPYKTVGFLLCSIMAVSGGITLLVLPAILRLGEKQLFKRIEQPRGMTCNCGFCIVVSLATVLVVALNIHQYAVVGWSKLTWISIAAVPVMALVCSVISRRQACKTQEIANRADEK